MQEKLNVELERDLNSLLMSLTFVFCLFNLMSDRMVLKGEGRAHKVPEQWHEGRGLLLPSHLVPLGISGNFRRHVKDRKL